MSYSDFVPLKDSSGNHDLAIAAFTMKRFHFIIEKYYTENYNTKSLKQKKRFERMSLPELFSKSSVPHNIQERIKPLSTKRNQLIHDIRFADFGSKQARKEFLATANEILSHLLKKSGLIHHQPVVRLGSWSSWVRSSAPVIAGATMAGAGCGSIASIMPVFLSSLYNNQLAPAMAITAAAGVMGLGMWLWSRLRPSSVRSRVAAGGGLPPGGSVAAASLIPILMSLSPSEIVASAIMTTATMVTYYKSLQYFTGYHTRGEIVLQTGEDRHDPCCSCDSCEEEKSLKLIDENIRKMIERCPELQDEIDREEIEYKKWST